MARRPIGFDVGGMAEGFKNAGSVEQAATGGSTSKGNYNQPGGTVNRNNKMKAAPGLIGNNGSAGENEPMAGGRPEKGRGYSK